MSNKKNNKIVIMCDCHNTLMNSNEAWVEAFSEFLGNEKKEEISLWLYGKKPRRELAKKYNIRFEDVENSAGKYLKRNEGLICILQKCKENNVPLYVVSNAPKYRVINDLETVGLLELFNNVYTGDDGGKKNKKIFDDILKEEMADYGVFIGNEEFDDHIEHDHVVSVVLTSFLRDRFSTIKEYKQNDNGVIIL